MSEINSMEANNIVLDYTKNLLLFDNHWNALEHLIKSLIDKERSIIKNDYTLVSNLIDLFTILNKKIGVDNYSSFETELEPEYFIIVFQNANGNKPYFLKIDIRSENGR